jgi:hypothetical protein
MNDFPKTVASAAGRQPDTRVSSRNFAKTPEPAPSFSMVHPHAHPWLVPLCCETKKTETGNFTKKK